MRRILSPGVTKSRRTFLRGSAVMLSGALLSGRAYAATQACHLTEADILGPFYRFGAPFQTQLARGRSSPLAGKQTS